MSVAVRRIWLCADDYGMAPGVNKAIRQLIEQKRINATSVMVVGAAIDRAEVNALTASVVVNADCAIGLHVTLTAPFHPLTMHFKPLHGTRFLPLASLLQSAFLRRLDPEIIEAEVLAQISAFRDLFGRTPDYVDGHQHVQLFPQIRDGFLAAVKRSAPDAWARQCGRAIPQSARLANPKAFLLDALSATFRKKCVRTNTKFNAGFAGAYDFSAQKDFGELMRSFLDALPNGGLIMCHPGFVDETLSATDPVTLQREREFAYLSGNEFPLLLQACNATLARN
ncbi:MAG: ChbG/HpnK family deacetylase [Afipia sp.]|nr:ChbG/HpnK family deacetylase [Afipia sp.]